MYFKVFNKFLIVFVLFPFLIKFLLFYHVQFLFIEDYCDYK